MTSLKNLLSHHYMKFLVGVRVDSGGDADLEAQAARRGKLAHLDPCWLPALNAVSGSMCGALACIHRLRPISATFMRYAAETTEQRLRNRPAEAELAELDEARIHDVVLDRRSCSPCRASSSRPLTLRVTAVPVASTPVDRDRCPHGPSSVSSRMPAYLPHALVAL